MKKNLLSLLFLSLLALSSAFAQSRKITGTITGADDGQPLPGVSVKVQGTTIGTQSDAQGNYSLNAPSTAKALIFTYIGYSSQTVSIGARTSISVKLVQDAKALSEVQITTGYNTEKISNITGSVAVVGGKEIEDLPVQSFDKALQGRAAGVQVTSASGQPGGGVNIVIRGVATIQGSTTPLYIIDGVQVSPGGLSTISSQNVLADINPADIESIEVLKDAGSASIYGSQASNGVVIVTTKQGKAGQTKVRASAQYGYNTELNPYKTLNADQWYQLQREGTVNKALRTGNSVGAAVAAINTTYFGSAADPVGNIPTYDWYNAIFRKGKTADFNLSFSGGDANNKYFVSGSYEATDGTIIASKFTRGTLRANLNSKVSKLVSTELSLNISADKTIGPTTGQGFFTNTPFTGALFTPPFNPIYNTDGTFNVAPYPYGGNLVQELNQELRQTGSFQTISHFALNFEPIKGLVARAFAGVEFADGHNYSYRPATIPIYAANGGTGNENYQRNIDYNLNGTLAYNHTFAKDHNFSALGGVEYKETNGQFLSASAQNFSTPLLTLLSSAGTYTAEASTFTGYKIISYFGSVKYDYKGKYLLSANLRDDGSSRFGANSRFGVFGGATAGWRVSQENFLKSVEFLSDFKIRASYGVTGVPPTNDYASLDQYASGGAAGGYNGAGSIRQTALGNASLAWERSAQTDLGVDISLFNSRISMSVDVYQKKNTNLLLNVNLPTSSGFGSILQNIGAVDAKGLDFNLNTVNVDYHGFQWTTNFNIALTRNKLVSLYNGLQFLNTNHNLQVGLALNQIWQYVYAGVNPADGRPMYYDKNYNITYNPITGDQHNVGDQNPDSFGGFSNSFSYKGLTLDVLFQYEYGREVFLQSAQIVEASGAYTDNQVITQLNNRWTTPGQITDTPRPYNGSPEPGTYDPTNFTSRYVQSASYIRLKQVTLTYKLPSSLTKKYKIPTASFFVQGLNLATWTNFRDQDPESTGNTLNSYPNPRTVTGGITLDF